MNWKMIDNMRKRYIRQGERTFARMYATIRKQLDAELEKAETAGEIERIANDFIVDQEVFEKAITDTKLRVGVAFAKITHQRFKSANMPMQTKEVGIDEGFWLELMQQYINRKIASKITQVIQTEYKDIQANTLKAITLGSENGWGAERIAREIVKEQGKMDFWKAKRIARTEIVGASNEGAIVGASQAGIELEKVWLSSPSGDPRDAHLAINGDKVGMDEMFYVNGEPMEYPHDPNAPASEVINCRCAVGFEPKQTIEEIAGL